MKATKLLAISGAGAFALGMTYLLGGLSVKVLDKAARSRDNNFSNASNSISRCEIGTWVEKPKLRTPVVGESIVLKINMHVWGNRNDCKMSVDVEAAGFDKDPNSSQTYNLGLGDNARYWTVSPKQAGEHDIVVVFDRNEFITTGIHVLSNSFFDQTEMNVISAALSLLGPAATIPWWLEWVAKRRDRREPNNAINSQK
jgi:hypothetical protein